MQSTFKFLDIAKFADFLWKNADVNRTHDKNYTELYCNL